MNRRTIVLTVLGLASVAALAATAIFGAKLFVERQRFQDADPAFRPLAHLNARILCNPIAFHRYCYFLVDFGPDSALCDANAGDLASLNKLPAKYELRVTIRTHRISDQALPTLLEIDTFDLLDVTETTISNSGIEQLRARFPQAIILKRDGQ
jgi:hypothetical protein